MGVINSLVLNLGHSPLYRHFYKCLHIEMLKIFTCLLTVSYIFFARQFQFEFYVLNVKLFTAMHAIERCSMLNGSFGDFELPLFLSKKFQIFTAVHNSMFKV